MDAKRGKMINLTYIDDGIVILREFKLPTLRVDRDGGKLSLSVNPVSAKCIKSPVKKVFKKPTGSTSDMIDVCLGQKER